MALILRSVRFIKLGKAHSSLAFETVKSGESKERVHRGIVIHGLMGAAKNLRPFCARLLKEVAGRSSPNTPGWELALVDLRNHGKSAGFEHLKSPHNLQSAAKDIAELIESESWNWPDVVIGHSFGGKVALEFGESCAHGRYGSKAVAPKQLWVLDSIPGKLDIEHVKETQHILTFIRSLPQPMPSHRWLLDRLMEKGFSRSLALWIGSNSKRIEPSSEQMLWIFDVNDIDSMFWSYRETSYWSFLEAPTKGTDIGIVRAENSDRWSEPMITQLERLVKMNQQKRKEQGTIHYEILKNSGHWVHVDNPKGLIDIITPSLLHLAKQ